MAETFPWASQRFVSYNPNNLLIASRVDYDHSKPFDEQERPVTSRSYGFSFNYNNKPHYFIPKSVIDKGFVQDEFQFYLPGVLKPGAISEIEKFPIVNVQELERGGAGYKFSEDYKESKFKDDSGYLIPASFYDQVLKNPYTNIGTDSYKLGIVNPDGVSSYEIQGLGNRDGQVVYIAKSSGRQNPRSWIQYQPNPEFKESSAVWSQYYEPGKKWYETPLGVAGLALIGGGLAGAFGPAAGASAGAAGTTGGTAAAGGAGIVGTPGVSTVFPVAAPVAPTVTSIAPMAAAGGAAAAGATSNAALYPAVEVAPSFTPAPGSLQAALPGLGVETAASAAPFTAIPGSFQAALPVLGIASAPSLAGNLSAASSGISATDALRIANQARGLLGAGQNPIIPQQQGLPQQAGGAQGVDYSKLLSLLQLQAGLPGVAPLTAPAQLRQIYQPTLLPNVLSLLG